MLFLPGCIAANKRRSGLNVGSPIPSYLATPIPRPAQAAPAP
ncbi:hypothetical protein [Hymenobacter sp. UYAg731]